METPRLKLVVWTQVSDSGSSTRRYRVAVLTATHYGFFLKFSSVGVV